MGLSPIIFKISKYSSDSVILTLIQVHDSVVAIGLISIDQDETVSTTMFQEKVFSLTQTTFANKHTFIFAEILLRT